MQADEIEYVGFWTRFVASVVDTILAIIVVLPFIQVFYGKAFWADGFVLGPIGDVLSWLLFPVAVVIFWVTKQATPGKMLFSAKVVDADTGNPLTPGQAIGRYLAYYLAVIPFGLGFIWAAFDKRKQGWHDKLAGTVVIREK
ncbi:MAG: RDD family protein [Methylophilus sp.]|uniref:RDD family protein n=1 Tax=Methylophilus sp. TaxID=29541 RepID=UPI003FA03B25